MVSRLATDILAVFVLGLMVHTANAADQLTIHHIGEYAAVPWTANGARNARVEDLNFSVASINLNGEISESFLAGWAEYARIGKAQGKFFLPRIYFWDGNDRFEGPLLDIEVYWQRVDTFLAAMPLDGFHGIVLAEENVAGGGRAEVLAELYRRIKAKYDVAVYQWWSPSGTVPTWNIPADGWVIDEYFVAGPRFRRIVLRYLVTGVPLVVMPHAAWSTSEQPWSAATWQSLEDQLQVCREFNLPTAFYWVYNTGCHFGLGCGNFMDDINARILAWGKEVQSLPVDYTGLPSADISRGDGLEIAPFEEGQLLFNDSFDTSQFIEDADIEGFRHLLWDDSRTLALRSGNGTPPRSSLTYRFAGDFPAHHVKAAVSVTFLAPGSRATLSLSADGGKSWPYTVTSEELESQDLIVTSGDDVMFHELREFRVRVTMEGTQSDGAVVARIDNVRISAELSIPAEPEVTLKPTENDAKHFTYHDDFQTQKFRYSAVVNQRDKLEWSRGSIAVRMQPGGAQPELIWKVTAPQPLNNIAIAVNGKANNGSLGTNHYLDISTDGKTWTHGVSTEGLDVNGSGWASHGLTIEVPGDSPFKKTNTFFVRLRLHAQAYQEVHPYLSGVINELRIDATAR
ncbi:MAG: hypothetical protein O2955_14825 [Planctomycetota bacterium]|nr:hypothetical protein [Planctomycetota bacterium]MDA1213787.1 hypothetical protein [Planctomycetota bacterium]